MASYFDLRQLVHRLQNRYLDSKKSELPPIQGVPPGIDIKTIQAICAEAFHTSVLSVSYYHLSGWKSAGAYRLIIETHPGEFTHLIFKDTIYETEEIPALLNLPVRPGPAEYAIYRQPMGPLANYLPTVYLAEEIVPNLHYHYIFEDLASDYHIVKSYEDILNFSRLLPNLHLALNEWAAQVDINCLIQYDRDFSLALQLYARRSLEDFSQHVEDTTLHQVLSHWKEITQIHLLPEFFTLQPRVVIHGDANYTNIHINRYDSQKFKIVDWEWAGVGSPLADLASLLKGAPGEVEARAVREFIPANKQSNLSLAPGLTSQQYQRMYQWCKLERGMLDASFLAIQHLSTRNQPQFSLPNAISHALQRVWDSYKQLSNEASQTNGTKS